MMTNASVVTFILAVLLISCSYCQSSAFQGNLRGLKRQIGGNFGTCSLSDFQQFDANSPQDCATEFSPLDFVQNISLLQNQGVITAFYKISCQPICRSLLTAFLNRCNLSQFTDAVRTACSRNNVGALCYEQFSNSIRYQFQLIWNCSRRSSICTPSCQNALTAYGNNYGCCVNAVNYIAIATLGYNLWSDCGVVIPQNCELEISTPPRNLAEAPKFVKVFFLLTLVVIVGLLL